MGTQQEPSGRSVTLVKHEILLALTVGGMRNLAALAGGLPDANGKEGVGWNEHIEGAGGELAVAKLKGWYWDGSVNTFKDPDLGWNTQVRTRSQHDYDLLVRKKDDNDSRFVLVTGAIPEFYVRGWMYGGDAKQEQWKKRYGGRPPAYFVPHNELKDIESLTRG